MNKEPILNLIKNSVDAAYNLKELPPFSENKEDGGYQLRSSRFLYEIGKGLFQMASSDPGVPEDTKALSLNVNEVKDDGTGRKGAWLLDVTIVRSVELKEKISGKMEIEPIHTGIE